jgi:hypothetical protein
VAAFAREALELAATPLERARALETLGYTSFVRFDGTAAWECLREAADIVRSHAPEDRARLARICGFAAMVPTRSQGLMRKAPRPEEVRPYLELGLECAREEDTEALVMLFASEALWEFGFSIAPTDASGDRAQQAAERALEVATDYAKQRVQFDRPIGSFQALKHRLADLATEIECCRLLVYDVAARVDADPGAMFPREASMAKLKATETAKKMALEGMQMMGGYGYATEYDMERYVRSALVTTIFGGTNEIQREIIGRTYGL